jgi:hypothetical protein
VLVEALQGRVQQFLHCGTIWVHGPSVEYGIRKAEIETYLLNQATSLGLDGRT